jgi:hypothetical protein
LRNRQSIITSGAVGELETKFRSSGHAVDSRPWPEVRHIDQTVYDLASVYVWFILLTLHVNEVKHRARTPELVYSRDVMRLIALKSFNPSVYGLASVNICILTLHVNEVKLRALEAQSHGIVGCGY